MRRNSTFILLLAAVAVTALVLTLNSRFPWALESDDKSYRLVYLLLWLVIAGGGSLLVALQRPARAIRDFLVWGGLFATLIVGYSYRDVFQDVGRRVGGELMPSAGTANSDGSQTFKASQDGHFYVEATVEGATVLFLVDTGATMVVLSPADARRIGFDLNSLSYSSTAETANGVVQGAPVKLRNIQLGSLRLTEVAAEVNSADMSQSLLGMSFLSRLSGYDVHNGELTLHP
jgi:aspartyl protease family protein